MEKMSCVVVVRHGIPGLGLDSERDVKAIVLENTTLYLHLHSSNFGGFVLGCIEADCLQVNIHFTLNAVCFKNLHDVHTFAPL